MSDSSERVGVKIFNITPKATINETINQSINQLKGIKIL